MCVYIVMGDPLCIFTFIYSNEQLFISIFNKCVKLGYTELVWWLFIQKSGYRVDLVIIYL